MRFAATASSDDFTAHFGATHRGLIPILDTGSVLEVIYPNMTLLRREDGRIVGFSFSRGAESVTVDYRSPASIRRACSYLQPPSRNLALAAKIGAEEKLAHFLRAPNVLAWERVCAELGGLTPWVTQRGAGGQPVVRKGMISLKAANRLGEAIVNEALENAIGNARLGGLKVVRKFPPSLRGRVSDSLGGGSHADGIRDLFYQFPLLALWPRAVASAAVGEKLKDVAEQLDLPKSARRVHAKAVGLINWLLKPENDDDADTRDFGWLTKSLCDALPNAAFRQKLVIGHAIRTALQGSNERGAEAGIWLARLSAELKSELDLPPGVQEDLAVYLNADEDTIAASVVDAWHDNLPLSKAIENADFLHNYLLLLELPGGGSFSKPAWAPDSLRLEHSTWRLDRIRDAAMLSAEARRLENCAKTYAAECAKGETVLYVVSRPATGRDRPGDIHDRWSRSRCHHGHGPGSSAAGRRRAASSVEGAEECGSCGEHPSGDRAHVAELVSGGPLRPVNSVERKRTRAA